MKKNILVLAALLCLLALLAACGQAEPAPTTGTEQQVQTPATQVILASEGNAGFALVGKADTYYMEIMQSQLGKLLDAEITVCSSAANVPENLVQVVIGNPNRIAPATLTVQVPYFGYLMAIEDGVVYILGYDDYVLEEAAEVFCDMAAQNYAEGNLKLEADWQVATDISEEYNVTKVTQLDGGRVSSIHDLDDGHQMAIVSNVQKQEFNAYRDLLTSEGYTLYMENEMNGNLFYTYTNASGVMMHIYWLEYYEEARIIVAQDPVLPLLENAGEKICTPLLHQLEALDTDKSDGGMGFIIRLEDGRFLIFDGGHDNADSRVDIYDFLKANAPDPENIVIAAWYLSHAHGDHTGAFEGFVRSYCNDATITLQSVLFNPCDTAEQMQNTTSASPDVEAALKRYCPDVPVIKPMTGQKLTFSGTTIEIMYTMSDFMPNVITMESDWEKKGTFNGDYNVQTMVCIVDIDSTADKGDRMFMMGDTTVIACNEMCSRYGSYLKCDIVQVSHHGLGQPKGQSLPRRNNSTKEIYELVDADIALWPAGEAKMKERSTLPVNEYLLSIVDTVICARDGGYTMEFGN